MIHCEYIIVIYTCVLMKREGHVHRIVISRNEVYKSELDLGKGSFGEVKKYRRYVNPDKFSVGQEYAIKLPLESKPEKAEYSEEEVKILKYIKTNLIMKGKLYYVEYFTDWIIFINDHKNYCPQTSATNQENNDQHKGFRGSQILMEYCPNSSLKAYISARRNVEPFQYREVLFFAREILRAVQYLHEECIIHRDIKPDNILLTKDFNIKLCDFGIAFQGSSPKATTSNYAGTQLFMAPQIKLKQTYNCLVDEWSIGKTILDLLKMKVKGSQEDQAKLNTILQGLLVENPQQRKSAKEILEDSNLFDSIEGFQDQIRSQLRQKKNRYKARTKKVFYIHQFGYCVVLQNCRTFLITQPRWGAPDIIELDNEVLEQRLMNNWTGEVFKVDSWFYQKRKRQIDAACYMVPKEYLTFMEKWRENISIDAFAGDTTTIIKAEIVHSRALCLKLSNSVIEFCFASESLHPQTLTFDLSVSFNYNRKFPEKVCFSYKSKESVEREFDEFLEDPHKKQYAKFIQNIFRNWADEMKERLLQKKYWISYD